MNSKANPILLELTSEMPDSIQTYKNIKEPKSYAEIAVQANKEIFCLRNMERNMDDGQSAKSFLQQNGYQFLFDNADEEDAQEQRLRLLGTLQLIAELSEDLAED